jgi:hypothetical protein
MLCCVVVRYRVPRDSTLTALGHYVGYYVGYCPFSALFSALSPSMLSARVSALCIACLFAWDGYEWTRTKYHYGAWVEG